MEEFITEVDKNDNFLGLRPRSDFYKNHELIHRSTNLLLFNNKGELLLQKRSNNKKWFPGLYDFSASGTVGDESYEECMKREIKEELGLNIKFVNLFKYLHSTNFGKAYKMVYTSTNNNKIFIDKFEVELIRWIKIPKLINEIIKYPKKFTPQFIEGINIYKKLKDTEK